MSFAADAKSELCKVVPQNLCCQKAECYGLLLFGKNFYRTAISVTTEHAGSARLIAQLAAQTAGVIAEVRSAVVYKRDSRNVLTVSVEGAEDRKALLNFFGHTGAEVSLRLNRSNLENECCMSAFLRGVFLCCGTATAPQKDYHLEFSVPYSNLAKDLCSLLMEIPELDLQPGIVNRRGIFVVYVKGSEYVADLLTYIGAPIAAMELMQAKMLKEVRNNVNRKTNFETANLDKTASAAAKQILALQKISQTSGSIQNLPDDLREIAELRMQNPEMSLRELGQNLSEPLSRSGVNHRLQRIVAFAEQLPNIQNKR